MGIPSNWGRRSDRTATISAPPAHHERCLEQTPDFFDAEHHRQLLGPAWSHQPQCDLAVAHFVEGIANGEKVARYVRGTDTGTKQSTRRAKL